MNSRKFRTQIEESIRHGILRPGEPVGLACDLAERFEVPLITVNRVLRSLADEGQLVRVKRKGTFVAAKPRQRSLRIGLAFPSKLQDPTPEYAAAIDIFLKYAREVLEHKSLSAVPVSFEDLHQESFDAFLHLDGLLSTADFIDSDTIPVLLKKKYPVAIVQHTIPISLPFIQVVPDIVHGFSAAAKAFRIRGIRKITLLSDNRETHLERCEKFRLAAQWFGYAENDIGLRKISSIIGAPPQLSGYKLGEEILKDFTPGSAFFVPSDLTGFGLLSCFLEGKLVPDKDFLLIGFDNLEDETRPFGKPMLTSVSFPKHEIIREAIDLLCEHIANPMSPRMISILPTDLVFRETFRELPELNKNPS